MWWKDHGEKIPLQLRCPACGSVLSWIAVQGVDEKHDEHLHEHYCQSCLEKDSISQTFLHCVECGNPMPGATPGPHLLLHVFDRKLPKTLGSCNQSVHVKI